MSSMVLHKNGNLENRGKNDMETWKTWKCIYLSFYDEVGSEIQVYGSLYGHKKPEVENPTWLSAQSNLY